MHLLAIALVAVASATPAPQPRTVVTDPPTITVRLTEWAVTTSTRHASAGRTALVITNAGTIPHVLEIEGNGKEHATTLLLPGRTDTLRVTLRAGTYELYCPVGNGSHKHQGMATSLRIDSDATHAAATRAPLPVSLPSATVPTTRGIEVVGGGAVVQILPGPFPFADSAAGVIAARPPEQQADLHHKAELGPYSNIVAWIRGTARFAAWDRGAISDSVAGEAAFTTQDGARWALRIDRVQTRDIPFNPRFGGVIMGLYYHGMSGAHTPLVPTIQSTVALWAFGHLRRNDVLVSDSVMVHVMLLSRTRRPGTFALMCWDCTRNPADELQLQITLSPGQPALDAPGGVLFINWSRSGSRRR
jgi:hypothetical protein